MTSHSRSRSRAAAEYGEASIRVLKGLEPVRQRPGMYTRTDSPLHIVQEVIDNAADEILAGFGRHIDVTLHADGAVTVQDDGRGIPTGMHPEENAPVLEIVFTRLHAGGKFDKRAGGAYSFSGGLHGVGVSVTNALSRRLDVTVWRDGKAHTMGFADGEVRERLVARLPKAGEPKTGTRVTVWPDAKYFDTAAIAIDELERLLRSKAVLLPGTTVTLTVEKTGRTEKWRFDGGLQQYLQASLGADWVSIAGTTTLDVGRAAVRAAHEQKKRVSAEPGTMPASELIRLGVDTIDRVGFVGRSRDDVEREASGRPDYPRDDRDAAADYLWQYAGGTDARPVIPKAQQQRIALVPMLASFNGTLSAESLKQDAALQALPARWRDGLLERAHAPAWPGAARAAFAAEVRRRVVRAFLAAGARIVTAVDVGSSGYNIPGAGVHRELAMLVAAGLSPAEAIRAATVNCADLVGAGTNLGRIAVGFKADLIAVEGDPLAKIEDLQRITLIVRGGEVLERPQLLAQARRAIR